LKKEYSVLIASNNREYMLLLKDYFEKMGCFFGCKFAFDGKEALTRLKELQPDLFVLDLVLAEIDGLSLLEQIRRERLARHTRILVTSNVGSEYIASRSLQYGADFLLIMPMAYPIFCARVLDLLREVRRPAETRRAAFDVEDVMRVTRILQRLGFLVNSKGFKYVRYAICLVLRDESYLDGITTRLYPAVAETFHADARNVERNIRHAIEVAWMRGDINYAERLFGYTVDPNRGKPTNTGLIAGIADYIQLQKMRIDS